MIPASLNHLLACRRTLLLQGPMGKFFTHLADVLRQQGQRVWKVNFNGGDDRDFGGPGVRRFQARPVDFREWLAALLGELQVDAVVLFGQSRPQHATAIELARERGIVVFVFEEGYVRPDYVTLEMGGVNAASALPREAAFYRALPAQPVSPPSPTGQRFGVIARIAMRYALACHAARREYPHYRHHRSLAPLGEGLRWVRGAGRQWRYRLAERGLQDWLSAPAQHKRFFLVPLQVWNDSQIVVHSHYGEMEDVIDDVLRSFSAHAPGDTLLVFKHHPLDLPYSDYTQAIRERARECGVAERVVYLHDQHLPTLLQAARGVVTVNSTAGLQALFHGTPVVTLGEAVYAVEGLVHRGPLDAFWRDPGRVDAELFQRFRSHLIHQTQLNASFYADAPGLPAYTPSSSTPDKRRLASASPMPSAADQAESWSAPTLPTLK
jgi:capsular polysaccharide export protein